jgi:hypothetical protein
MSKLPKPSFVILNEIGRVHWISWSNDTVEFAKKRLSDLQKSFPDDTLTLLEAVDVKKN